MPDYKETNITGTVWNRFGIVVACNPLSDNPAHKFIIYGEQEVASLSNGKINTTTLGGIKKTFIPTDEFPLMDANGAVIGTMTELTLYGILASHALFVAGLRDSNDRRIIKTEYPRISGAMLQR